MRIVWIVNLALAAYEIVWSSWLLAVRHDVDLACVGFGAAALSILIAAIVLRKIRRTKGDPTH